LSRPAFWCDPSRLMACIRRFAECRRREGNRACKARSKVPFYNGLRPLWPLYGYNPELRARVKILGLSFLILVGVTLMAEGFDVHVPKGYIYFAMAFSVAVEVLNIRMRRMRADPVKLRRRIHEKSAANCH